VVDILIRTNTYTFDCSLKSRVNLISGFVSYGRCMLFKVLLAGKAKCELNIKCLDTRNWSHYMKNMKDTVFVIDFFIGISVDDFMSVCDEVLEKNNCYVLVIEPLNKPFRTDCNVMKFYSSPLGYYAK
jgi:hypothetical protein